MKKEDFKKPKLSIVQQKGLEPKFIPKFIESFSTDQEASDFRKQNHLTVTGSHVPNPLLNFSKAKFPEFITKALTSLDFVKPTPIQSQTLPIALAGMDMIGIAATGSGKTLGFLLPAIVHIISKGKPQKFDGPIVLVLAPTRELAIQIEAECQKLIKNTNLKSVCVYGGQSKGGQASNLNKCPEILIATPGRLNDFLSEQATDMNKVSFLVLDEADRMLDMGFKPQIQKIIDLIPLKPQTLMWSATWSQEVQKISQVYLRQPIKIQLGSEELTTNVNIVQKFISWKNPEEKLDTLKTLLVDKIKRKEKILIFVETKRGATKLATQLSQFKPGELHGDKNQNQREDMMKKFKTGVVSTLITTNVASRGLDVKDINWVINYELPGDIETYVHRIGRTSRTGGVVGESLTFIGPTGFEDLDFMDHLEKLMIKSKLEVSNLITHHTKLSSTEKTKIKTKQREGRKLKNDKKMESILQKRKNQGSYREKNKK